MEDIKNPEAVGTEILEDKALRPAALSDYVGQEKLRKQLGIYIQSAVLRHAVLDHVLLAGPPGLGKTTLAQIVGNELGKEVVCTAGNILEKPADLAAILTTLTDGAVLFIDEIHRLPAQVEEILYPAMEDFKLDITIPGEAGVRVVTLPLAQFTLIGATTMAGSVSQPLRDRFSIQGTMVYYTPQELHSIVCRSANLMGQRIEDEAAKAIALRARGTPRVANRILRRVRDYTVVHGSLEGVITKKDSEGALALLGIDQHGLDELDQRMIQLMATTYEGKPMGLETLAAALGERAETIENSVEPYLIKSGLLIRSPRGRLLTQKGMEYAAAAK